MAIVPRGATISVLTIWADPISRCCNPMGAPILKAVPTVSAFGLNEPGRPRNDNIGDFANRKYSIRIAVISSAHPVPMAAPTTPIPNIYINM